MTTTFMNTAPRPFLATSAMPSIDATRVAQRLYVGSVPPLGRALQDAGFHVLVLCALPQEYDLMGRSPRRLRESGGYDGLIVLRVPLDDDFTTRGRPSEAELRLAKDVASEVATLILRGRRALFTCMQGRNRSAFVAGLTLHRLTGRPGIECAERIRSVRGEVIGQPVLANPWFNRVLGEMKARPKP